MQSSRLAIGQQPHSKKLGITQLRNRYAVRIQSRKDRVCHLPFHTSSVHFRTSLSTFCAGWRALPEKLTKITTAIEKTIDTQQQESLSPQTDGE
jgi:hypothetical protein